MRRTVSWAICAFILLAFPALAAEKVDLVRVHKAERWLELIGDGKVVRSYGIALGGAPVGHKHQEGDQRTPEGRYILDWRNPNSIAYKSIHVSYPNAGDLAAAKRRNVDAGGMIMIHGQPNGFGWWGWLLQLVDWTDGCIAVTDSDMDEIWAMVADGTSIEIGQ
ncbi:L,D-transpeptidase family protein [Mesorhizobium opportunistum]|uniref:L,D-transpeptidase family protein n=2 Tax=Mesorhizobium opportunistum TaxID=593909 RepID=A0ABV1YN45_9HYPH|nr:L,D-transpeptidase family protein [Mesorhizobium sp.]TIN91602.1 MAG: murein L,D-transpeptidase [Mesorhizobium sp.]TJU94506.1 MAG: murein L,D-transpeptidase [Mesorhizobium sp.]TJV14044.1 MAG: murein L,D-transpeptidase [Mesorhizobium sp.]